MRRILQRTPRGNTLLVAVVLLAVLSVVGAASVMLSSQERINASAKTRVDFLNACANAAQAKIWAEMGQYGLSYLGSTVSVTPMSLPDGTTVIGPAHYATADSHSTPQVNSVVFKVDTATASKPGASMNERDCTNGACGLMPLGSTYGMTAVCTDASGRAYEVELAVKFAL